MGTKLDLTGHVYGRLTVISYIRAVPKRGGYWACACTCGSTCEKYGVALRNGNVRSCGCLAAEYQQNQGKHNHCRRGAESLTWRSWKSMLDRCRPEHKSREYYFDRGITVCKRWHKFENFLADMGERPAGRTLDRKNTDKGYSKHNCRWATASEQQSNKTSTVLFTYQDETKTLTDWSKDTRCAVPYCTLHKRVRVYGFSFVESLTTKERMTK